MSIVSNPDITLAEDTAQQAPPLRGELAFAAALFGAACLFFYKARMIDSEAEIWPRTLAFLLILLSFLQVARCTRTIFVKKLGPPIADLRALLRRLFTVGWIGTYCLVAPWAGFGLAMAVLMPAYMWLAGERRLWIIGVATVVAVTLVSFVFGGVAGVPIWEADL